MTGIKKNNVTMTAVARRAGVSQATVSRALNHSAVINEETRLAVRRAMEELGYREREKERGRKNRIVLLMCPFAEQRDPLTLDFFGELLAGVQEILDRERFELTVVTLPCGAVAPPDSADLESAAGVIVVNNPSLQLVRHIRERGLPLIAAAADVVPEEWGIDMVINNNFQFGKQACRYMLEHGIDRFALLMPKAFEERILGVTLELARQGKQLPPEYLPELDSTDISVYIKTLLGYLAADNLPRGLIVQHYDAALALASILECHRLRIPEDVAIFTFSHRAGHDRFPMLLQFPREIGRKAAQGVFSAIRWPETAPCSYMVPARLVEPAR